MIVHDLGTLADAADAAAGLTRDEKYINPSWFWGDAGSFEETLRLIRSGESLPIVRSLIPDYASRVTAEMDAVPELGQTRRRQMVWADAGDEIDADRLNQQHERPWRSVRIGRARPIVRLGLNVAISCTNNVEEFAHIAARVCAVSDWLNVRGYGTEIVGLASAEFAGRRGSYYAYRFTVKAPTDPLDLEKIGACGCPGLYRGIMFRIFDRDYDSSSTWNGPCSTAWTESERAAVGVDYVITRYWNGRGQQNLTQGLTLADA